MADVREISDAEFRQEIQDEKVTIVDFWAPWCGPCRILSPRLERVAARYPGQVKVCKINVDEHQQVATEYGIFSIPTLLFFHRGEMVNRIVGAVSEQDLEEAIKKALAG